MSQNSLNDFMKSVFPIVTQCKKENDDNDINKLRHIVKEQLLERMRIEESSKQSALDQNAKLSEQLQAALQVEKEFFKQRTQ